VTIVKSQERDVEIRAQTIELAGGVRLDFQGGWGREHTQWTLEVTTGGRHQRIVFAADGTLLNIVDLTGRKAAATG